MKDLSLARTVLSDWASVKGALGEFGNSTSSDVHTTNMKSRYSPLHGFSFETQEIRIGQSANEIDLQMVQEWHIRSSCRINYKDDCNPITLPAFSCKAMMLKFQHKDSHDGPGDGSGDAGKSPNQTHGSNTSNTQSTHQPTSQANQMSGQTGKMAGKPMLDWNNFQTLTKFPFRQLLSLPQFSLIWAVLAISRLKHETSFNTSTIANIQYPGNFFFRGVENLPDFLQ